MLIKHCLKVAQGMKTTQAVCLNASLTIIIMIYQKSFEDKDEALEIIYTLDM
jgi:hypothetical protein